MNKYFFKSPAGFIQISVVAENIAKALDLLRQFGIDPVKLTLYNQEIVSSKSV